jgi:hypothetical protein
MSQSWSLGISCWLRAPLGEPGITANSLSSYLSILQQTVSVVSYLYPSTSMH